MQKIYYDPDKNLTIIDVSGVKPLKDIKKEFGNVSYEEAEIQEGETHKIENGKIVVSVIPEPVVDEKEVMIKEEIRKMAVDSLVSQGKIQAEISIKEK